MNNNGTNCTTLSLFNFKSARKTHGAAVYGINLPSSLMVAILLPVAVNALVLAAIWRRSSLRTPSYILLDGFVGFHWLLHWTQLAAYLCCKAFDPLAGYSAERGGKETIFYHNLGIFQLLYYVFFQCECYNHSSHVRWKMAAHDW